MKYRLTCEQISALINFYANDSLSEILCKYIQEHLDTCPSCMEKYMKIKSLQTAPADDSPYITKQYEDFKNNLSAYIDNELDDLENIKIKKITISNPLARQDLENIYTFKKLMHTSFEKTKNGLKNDYAKNIINNVKASDKKIDPFFKLSAIFFVMVICIAAGLIKILYF